MAARVSAHNVEARYIEPLPWKKPHLAQTYAMGYAELGRDLDVSHAEIRQISGKSCIVGNMVAFEVDSNFAYVQPGATFRQTKITLDRARFAKFGTRGVDIAVQTTDYKDQGIPDGRIALCDLQIARRARSSGAKEYGSIQLDTNDARTGGPVPARVGIYDATGRAPLPSDHALLVERFADKVRSLSVDLRAFWPSDNRVAFYVKGIYESKLPVGTYELVATHGPEFRAYHGRFEVRKDQVTRVSIPLERYADLPGSGWYSGDDHIHLARDESRDLTVWTQVAAEDVHVGNLLQMGNISGVYFEQPAWGKAGRFEHDGYLIASGQEDPRTGHIGHTIHENLEQPIHLGPEAYFLYHRVFEESHRQGGISGFAHLNGGWFNARRGLALEIPFGSVDFLEILQAGKLSTDSWYDFLNLGFKITPSAGSDFPYTDLPGVVRVYSKVDRPDDPDSWYASFRAGHAYVTNGPFLELSVNGHSMGDEIHVARGSPLEIAASARLNPDVDRLDRLELVVLGSVAKSESAQGRDRVQLNAHLRADHSMWIAVRAYGGRQEEWNMTAAHSAPIYVVVDGEPSWNREQVPQIVARERGLLQELLTAPLVPTEDLEAFATSKLLIEQWPRQRRLLEPRVRKADAFYRDLLQRAQKTPAR
jgi:hypothetical protein